MNRDEKTLVILSPGFPESETDTSCLPMLQNFTRILKELYPRLNVIILSFEYPYLKKTYKLFDTIVISFNGKNKTGLARLVLRRKLHKVLKEIHHKNNITCLLSLWCGECALVGKRFAGKYGIRHYCWILGQDAKKDNKYVKRIHPKPGELIALSDFLQDEFEKNHGTRPQHLIPAAIDPRLFHNAVIEKDIDILGAGSLIPLKRFDIFIEVIAEVKKQYAGVKVLLIGKGPEKIKLQELIKEYGIEANITLTGEIPYSEVLSLMERSKILLHPSTYEGFSGVCQEALYAGARVISFCRAMNHEIENWFIMDSKEKMKQKIVEILRDYHPVPGHGNGYLMEDTVRKMMALIEK